MGKSTISMVIFNSYVSYVKLPEGNHGGNNHGSTENAAFTKRNLDANWNRDFFAMIHQRFLKLGQPNSDTDGDLATQKVSIRDTF